MMWIPKRSNEVFGLPDSVQKALPIYACHPNGIFEHNRKYSVSCRFTDIEYAASDRGLQNGNRFILGVTDGINIIHITKELRTKYFQ